MLAEKKKYTYKSVYHIPLSSALSHYYRTGFTQNKGPCGKLFHGWPSSWWMHNLWMYPVKIMQVNSRLLAVWWCLWNAGKSWNVTWNQPWEVRKKWRLIDPLHVRVNAANLEDRTIRLFLYMRIDLNSQKRIFVLFCPPDWLHSHDVLSHIITVRIFLWIRGTHQTLTLPPESTPVKN